MTFSDLPSEAFIKMFKSGTYFKKFHFLFYITCSSVLSHIFTLFMYEQSEYID